MTETTTNSHVSVSLPNISHIKKLEEIKDYTEWSQDVQATLINGGWWKYVCPPPDFPMSDPDYIPCPDPLLAAGADESVTGNTRSAQDIQVKLLTAHRKWVQGDNAARHIIRSTIAQHIKTSLPPVITSEGITHARDYWKLLESDYDAVSFNDTADLEVQLSLLQMTDSPLKYVSEICCIQSTLLKCSCGCSNVSLINHLIRGLPNEKHWREWRHTEMASWKLQHDVTFNDIARSNYNSSHQFRYSRRDRRWDCHLVQQDWFSIFKTVH